MIHLNVDVSALLKAQPGKSLTLVIDAGPQVLDDLEVDFIRGTVDVIRVQKGLFVEGTIKSQLSLECVRCLDSFVFPVTLQVEETFRLPGMKPVPDIPYAVSEDGKIDLAPLLRELAWLSIPMKPLCAPDCEGLCPQCGTNLNRESCSCEDFRVDPRLAKLKELL